MGVEDMTYEEFKPILKCCRGKQKNYKDFIFRFEKE